MIHTASAGSPFASEVFALIALVVLSLGVLLILRHFLPLRTTPAYLLVPVFFAVWLPAGIILLVPIDLASSAATDDEAARGIWLPERVLRVSWRITYWLTFCLTWYRRGPPPPPPPPFFSPPPFSGADGVATRFILPILAEYSDAGYREPKDRLLYALRQNAQYHAVIFGSGVLGLIYVFISYGPSFTSLKTVVMALAYGWGLVLAIYLMGHGLVAIPRRLLRNANISGRLRRLQSHAPRLYAKMEDAELTLEDLETQVSELSRRKVGSARLFQDWIEELVDMTSLPENPPRAVGLPAAESRALPTVVTEQYMADLTRQLVRARHARSRYLDEWSRLLQDAADTQAILNSAGSKKLEFGRTSPSAGFWDRITVLTPYTRYLLHYQVVPQARLFLGGLFGLSSVFIVWSEMVKVALPNLSVIRLSVVHYWEGDRGQVGFVGQVVASFWILYMFAAALTSITEVKVWRGRALVKRNTAHESAFWYASQVARLSVPLSYNFMTFLSQKVYDGTVFYQFLGSLINLTPLGTWFDYLFPVFILVPVCATLFGLYGRVKRFLGFGDLVEDDDDEDNETGYGTGSWREGRDLIDRELHGTSIRQRRREGPSAADAANAAGRAAPVVTVPGGRRGQPHRAGEAATATTPFATSPSNLSYAAGSPSRRSAGVDPTPSSSSRRALPEDPGDENFFQALGHRMKNTIDTIDAPQWFQDIKKPKWMGGDDEDDGGGGGGGRPSASRADSDPIRRWFGGGDSTGRIRL